MPAARPDEAPPREVAGKAETDKNDKGDVEEAKPDEHAAPAPAKKPATKKRR
jgi:hypothetical protein